MAAWLMTVPNLPPDNASVRERRCFVVLAIEELTPQTRREVVKARNSAS
jgi:hypothetical protein